MHEHTQSESINWVLIESDCVFKRMLDSSTHIHSTHTVYAVHTLSFVWGMSKRKEFCGFGSPKLHSRKPESVPVSRGVISCRRAGLEYHCLLKPPITLSTFPPSPNCPNVLPRWYALQFPHSPQRATQLWKPLCTEYLLWIPMITLTGVEEELILIRQRHASV